MIRMKSLMCVTVLVCVGAMSAQAKNVGFIGTGGAADPDIVSYLEGGGHTVTSLSPVSDNPGASQALADASDVVLISETIGSTSISEGGVFHLLNHPVTVITWEAFMFDEAKMTGITPPVFTFRGICVLVPPYCFLPTTRLAYCTVTRR